MIQIRAFKIFSAGLRRTCILHPYIWSQSRSLHIWRPLLPYPSMIIQNRRFFNSQKQLENHPEFKNAAKELSDHHQKCGHSHSHGDPLSDSHDHVHLMESETIQNDHLRFGTMSGRMGSLYNEHGHSHDHSHGHANPLLVLSKKEFIRNPGVRITWIGLLSNCGLALGKFIGGIVFHSQALIADAVHALSDLVSDLLTLFSVSLASRKTTPDYPYGFGKIETVGSLAVSSILTLAGISIGWSSICTIVGPLLPHMVLDILASVQGHSHAHIHNDITNINAAWIAGISVFLKEWIFRATKKVAQDTNSNVLMANAWHHRVDSLTSLVALVTISSGYFLNIQSLDAVGGLLVSALVVHAGTKGMAQASRELVDRSLPDTDARYLEIKDITTQTLTKMLTNNNSKKPFCLKHLTVLLSGPNAHANMLIEAPIQRWENVLTLSDFELVSDHVRRTLFKNVPYLKAIQIEFTEEKRPSEMVEADPNIETPVFDPPSFKSQHKMEHTHKH